MSARQQVDFSDPYMVSQQFMLVRADEDRFSTPEEFAADPDLLIGSQTGTTNFYVAVYDVLDGDEANPRIKLFENFGATVQALIAGDVDMVLMDAASSRGYIGANPDKLKSDWRSAGDGGVRFHLHSRLRPGGSFQCCYRPDESRWLPGLPEQPLVLPGRSELPRMSTTSCPTWSGKTVVAVTGNDYTPLNFVDPASGQSSGLGVRGGERDLPAAELRGGLAGDLLGHDDCGGEGRAVRCGHGRDHDH